ncbi:MAG: galactokinase [Chthoniobacteraceae bacterium]
MRALEHFQERTGADATHLAFAPGRVNLIGEHTDYNGGFVLPMAIDPGIFVAARPRADRHVRIWSAQLDGPGADFDTSQPVKPGLPSWSNYMRGVIAGMHSAGIDTPGFDAIVTASLPAGGGLSSSAALEVATATLIESLAGVTLDPERKALLCQKAEHDFAGTPCGIMDQFAVTFGQRDHLLLIDCQSRERTLVPMRTDGASLLVINTMVRHELSDGGYRSRRDDCEEAARLLGVAELRDATPARVEEARPALPDQIYRRARHVVTENERTLKAVEALRRGDCDELGALMFASHDSLRDDFNVSCDELDEVVKAARELGREGGIYGCRMTGGGFGGCCIALVRTDRADGIAPAVRDRYHAATGIEPAIFATQPADGAAMVMQP